jgi:16S rRNA (guanine1207-N2)-methyltransferase
MPHYYSENQTSPLHLKKISAQLRGNGLEFYTASGVFSKDAIDKGTELLIQHASIPSQAKILDLGCGYGAVGIAMAKSFPDSQVLMTDVNVRAVDLAGKNIAHNRIANAEARQGNGFEKITGQFDVILLNPPQTAGKDICFQMIEQSKQHLKVHCSLQLVARHNKGGQTLEKKMREVFGNSQQTAKKSGYRVYVSVLKN